MPTVRLATKNVETLPAAGGARTDYFDDICTGLFLRVTPKGTRTWGVMFRVKGDLRRMTFGRATSGGASTGALPHIGLAEARQKAREALERVQKGEDPSRPETRSKGSVEAAAALWIKRDQDGKKTAHEATRIMKTYVLPVWGDRQLADIKRRDVIELVDDIAEERGGIMANRTLGRIKRMMTWATSRDMIPSNPAADVEKPAPERKRRRVLSNAEIVRLWHACGEAGWPFGHAVRMLILSGARRSEIFRLERNEIRHRAIILEPDRFKGEEDDMPDERFIPLAVPAWSILRSAPVLSGPFVFSFDGERPFQNIGRLKRRLAEAARLDSPWTLHDLRRTAATGVQRLGVPQAVTEAWQGRVGESKAGVAGIYQRYQYKSEVQDAATRWARHLVGILRHAKIG